MMYCVSVQGICEVITNPGLVNVDFADLKTIMSNKGIAHMGVGHGSGKNRAEEAVKMQLIVLY